MGYYKKLPVAQEPFVGLTDNYGKSKNWMEYAESKKEVKPVNIPKEDEEDCGCWGCECIYCGNNDESDESDGE